jgi:hypothetical protein
MQRNNEYIILFYLAFITLVLYVALCYKFFTLIAAARVQDDRRGMQICEELN